MNFMFDVLNQKLVGVLNFEHFCDSSKYPLELVGVFLVAGKCDSGGVLIELGLWSQLPNPNEPHSRLGKFSRNLEHLLRTL